MPKVLLRSEQSGGAVSMIDVVAPAAFPGPPLHVHDFDGLHAGELRAVLRAHGGRAGGRRAPGVGDAGLAGGHPRRAADRRVTV
jgi:hypothetical protein